MAGRGGAALFLFCFALVAVPAAAQDRGAVTGSVLDETGAVLPGASVELRTAAGARSATSDGVGTYRFDAVGAGPASLTFRLVNFSTLRRDLDVAAGENRVDAVLTLGMTADVVVTGTRTFRNIADLENPRENLVGVATSASVGAITAEQLDARPIMRPGEVLEAVPGFITSQHSGEGKANQYYLRGFNLDHGSDFATTLAGVPLNESSGAHAHGYTDVNQLIPGAGERRPVHQGPLLRRARGFLGRRVGQHQLRQRGSTGRCSVVSTGGQGWGRAFWARCRREVGAGNLLMALELSRNDGPWELPDDMRKVNGVLRYSQGDRAERVLDDRHGILGRLELDRPDPAARRRIGEACSRFGNIDPTDAGRTSRYSVAFDGLQSGGTGSIRLTAYALHGGLNLFQNFTYFLEAPDRRRPARTGRGRRWVSGARLVHRRLGNAASTARWSMPSARRSVMTRSVPSACYNGLSPSAAHERDSERRGRPEHGRPVWSDRDRVEPRLPDDPRHPGRLLPLHGQRTCRDLNSGSGTSGLVSPKITAVLGPWRGTELYLNYGQGFHSNDPRAATTRLSTRSPASRWTSEDPLVPARGAEVGLRTVALPGLQSTVALWYLTFDSELIFVGDAGIAEASRPSRRLGVEWTNYRAAHELADR